MCDLSENIGERERIDAIERMIRADDHKKTDIIYDKKAESISKEGKARLWIS